MFTTTPNLAVLAVSLCWTSTMIFRLVSLLLFCPLFNPSSVRTGQILDGNKNENSIFLPLESSRASHCNWNKKPQPFHYSSTRIFQGLLNAIGIKTTIFSMAYQPLSDYSGHINLPFSLKRTICCST